MLEPYFTWMLAGAIVSFTVISLADIYEFMKGSDDVMYKLSLYLTWYFFFIVHARMDVGEMESFPNNCYMMTLCIDLAFIYLMLGCFRVFIRDVSVWIHNILYIGSFIGTVMLTSLAERTRIHIPSENGGGYICSIVTPVYPFIIFYGVGVALLTAGPKLQDLKFNLVLSIYFVLAVTAIFGDPGDTVDAYQRRKLLEIVAIVTAYNITRREWFLHFMEKRRAVARYGTMKERAKKFPDYYAALEGMRRTAEYDVEGAERKRTPEESDIATLHFLGLDTHDEEKLRHFSTVRKAVEDRLSLIVNGVEDESEKIKHLAESIIDLRDVDDVKKKKEMSDGLEGDITHLISQWKVVKEKDERK